MFPENRKGISFEKLFAPYLAGASQITITDPYIRLFYQVRKVMELVELVLRHKAPEDSVRIHLITCPDEGNIGRQREYLDTIGSAAPLFPPTGSAPRLKAMIRQATADGILDAAVARRLQMGQPQDDGRKAFDARQKAAVERALAVLEKDPPRGLGDIGAISIACALGYLDFRFAAEPWRDSCPKLAAWFAEVSKLAPLAETVPVG